jgi:hypothetical protein
MTITEFLILSSAFTVGIITWASMKMAYFCAKWAIHDTLIIAFNFKPNLPLTVRVKGLIDTYCFTFKNTFINRVNGEYRIK